MVTKAKNILQEAESIYFREYKLPRWQPIALCIKGCADINLCLCDSTTFYIFRDDKRKLLAFPKGNLARPAELSDKAPAALVERERMENIYVLHLSPPLPYLDL